MNMKVHRLEPSAASIIPAAEQVYTLELMVPSTSHRNRPMPRRFQIRYTKKTAVTLLLSQEGPKIYPKLLIML